MNALRIMAYKYPCHCSASPSLSQPIKNEAKNTLITANESPNIDTQRIKVSSFLNAFATILAILPLT